METKADNRIKELRKARGLSLQALAERANTTHQQINRLEKGERSLTVEWMNRIAPALGVHQADLLCSSTPAPTSAPSVDVDAMADLVRLAFLEVNHTLDVVQMEMAPGDWAYAIQEQFKRLYNLRYRDGLEGKALESAAQAIADNVIPLNFARR